MAPDSLAWCAADPHFEQGDPALDIFFRWLEAFEASGTPNLCLMGDLFQVWIGLPHIQSEEQKQVLSALGRLAAAGRRVVYLMGNRDYFVEDLAQGAGLLAREAWDLEISGGGLVRFEHGDLINTSDRGYMRWREVSRAGTVRALFSVLPASKQLDIARRLERRLARTNLRYKAYRPQKELERWAERLSSEGVSQVVLGHFHVDEVVHAGGVEIRFLPQFREDGLHLRLAADGSHRLERFGPG
jgi:UDP-2,3-diacylglucosamine pyrophosphatase LpxH